MQIQPEIILNQTWHILTSFEFCPAFDKKSQRQVVCL